MRCVELARICNPRTAGAAAHDRGLPPPFTGALDASLPEGVGHRRTVAAATV